MIRFFGCLPTVKILQKFFLFSNLFIFCLIIGSSAQAQAKQARCSNITFAITLSKAFPPMETTASYKIKSNSGM
jgi:hypothetical protein